MRFKLSPASRQVTFLVSKKLHALDVLEGAAHVFSDRAAAYLEEKGKDYEITLKALEKTTREALEALADGFLGEVLNQALRQKLLANNRSIIEHVISRAMVSALADPAAGRPPADALTPEQQQEIDRLIAETEAEIAALAKSKGGADPLGIAKTWEETHDKPRVAGPPGRSEP